jgi:transcriptional regulator with XRE-family HTH domain
MLISERIFKLLKDKNMTQTEFAKRADIACSTISEWKKSKTNPSADKIMDICAALEATQEQLLSGCGLDEEEGR